MTAPRPVSIVSEVSENTTAIRQAISLAFPPISYQFTADRAREGANLIEIEFH